MENNKELLSPYMNRVHRTGIVISLLGGFSFVVVAFLICYHFNMWPTLAEVMLGCSMMLPIQIAFTAVEFATYLPIIGPGPTYLSFLTGNIVNMKLPSIVNTMKLMNVEKGTEKHEVLATIACCVASLLVIALLSVLVIFIRPLTPVLQWEPIQPAFDNVLPVVYGALAYAPMKNMPKLAIPSCILCVFLTCFVDAHTSGLSSMVGTILFAIIVNVVVYKRKQRKNTENASN